MANLPGVKEIRSISKFGLSVVTIVFEDDLGTYLPRQLTEKSNQHLKKSHLVLEPTNGSYHYRAWRNLPIH
jgi:Cu/Ag efflux pump CusA